MLFFHLFFFSCCRTYVFIHIYYSDVPAEFPSTVLQSSVFNKSMLLMKCNTFSFLSDISTTSFFIPCSFVSFSSNDTISRPTPFPVISGLMKYMQSPSSLNVRMFLYFSSMQNPITSFALFIIAYALTTLSSTSALKKS